ncbi:FAD/NAD-P-binding domain-containing protein [Zymoseptoria brevis]|uniref:FAD/NAD-P-binding domain-containing protein n=1 Tax=Zymoseptoria brevis TaxID=1047168 RepID=A0A0F4GHB2_9PEZI|nr:FAD/NAD-P-binding domain-containing protein [Zymoseptoria brevis]
MPLLAIVVGAGLAGLAVATGLARKGHQVTVYERRVPAKQDESESGIQLQPNVARSLDVWGMMEDLKELRTHDGGLIAHHDFRRNGPAWYGLRRVLKDTFGQSAIRYGAEILEGVNISTFDQNVPSITLDDGKVITCDLIVAADGSGSRIRQALFPHHHGRNVLNKAVWQISLPLDVVRKDDTLRGLLDEHHNVITVASGRSIFASPSPSQNTYDLQLIDHEHTLEQDFNPTALNERVFVLEWVKERFGDFDAATRKAIDSVHTVFKCKLVEVFDLPSWSSENGKVMMLGDAAHAMTPNSGQGTAMGIDDAAVLSELLTNASSGSDLQPLTKAYENLRRPRCETVLQLARAYGASWSAKDPEQIRRRNATWKRAHEQRHQLVEADSKAPPGSAAFGQRIETYDVFEAVREELARPKRAAKTDAERVIWYAC